MTGHLPRRVLGVPPRSRRRSRLLVGLAVGLLAVGWAAVPSTAAVHVGALEVTGGAATHLPGYGARGTVVVDYVDRGEVVLHVPVTNDGPLPLTVTAVSLGPEQRLALLTAGAALDLRLAPGETRTVPVPGSLGNCAWYHERELQLYDVLSLRGTVLGRDVQRTTDLVAPVLVRSPMIVGCPERLLDRQARNRS